MYTYVHIYIYIYISPFYIYSTQSTRSTSFNPEDSQSLKWLQHNVETAVEVKEKKIISSKDGEYVDIQYSL